MNRSILIVICDFLLVSLLAFSAVDINKVANPGAQRAIKFELATNRVDAARDKDLAAVMRLALNEERQNREQLLGELARARASISERDKLVQTTRQQLQSREDQAQKLQQDLQAREQQAQKLQQDLQTREQQAQQLQQAQLAAQQQFAAAQTNIQNLSRQLAGTSAEVSMSRERLAQLEAELRKQNDQSSALQKQLADLARSNQVVVAERQQLAGQLQVAEVEKRHATEQVAAMRQEVKVEREEKAKLAEGVKALATGSGQLAREIRDFRPLAANTIFDDFLTNRVKANFTAVRSTLFGESARRRDTETVLVTDGTNTFALCHVDDTPLTFWYPGTDWQGLTGTLNHDQSQCPISSVCFSWPDPRVVLVPVAAPEVKKLGAKVYRISADPYKFQDAVLVGAKEGYYGECRFQIDSTTPEYVRLDHSFIKGLFGKFNPSRGDLVFSKSGDLLGMMANSTYCLMLRKFDSTATFRCSRDVRDQHTGETLSRLYSFVAGLPSRLQ